jgi:hypothetical protein
MNERSDSNDVTGHANKSLINVSLEFNKPFCIRPTIIVSQYYTVPPCLVATPLYPLVIT